jgi:hypothetical protein
MTGKTLLRFTQNKKEVILDVINERLTRITIRNEVRKLKWLSFTSYNLNNRSVEDSAVVITYQTLQGRNYIDPYLNGL